MSRWNDKRVMVEDLRSLARFFAPLYLLAVSTLRTYMETVPFAADPEQHAYYLSVHHVFWFCDTLLLGMLALHFVTKVPVKRLVWLCYGMYAILLPILWVWLTGRKLALEYHPHEWHAMLRDIFTFVWTAPHNRPVIIDGGVAFVGISLVAYFYTRSAGRGILMGLVGFVIINLFAIPLLGPTSATSPAPLVAIPSAWTYQPFISAWYSFVAFWVMAALMARAGLFREDGRVWRVCLLFGLLGWAIFSVAAYFAGWFPHVYDAVMTGFPMGFCLFLLARVVFWTAGKQGSHWALALFLLALVCQAAVFGPIYAGNQERLTIKLAPKTGAWARDRQPFQRLRLFRQNRFDFAAPDETWPESFPPDYDEPRESSPYDANP